MNVQAEVPIGSSPARTRLTWAHGLMLCALAVLVAPVLVDLWQGPWQDDRHSHGPVLMAVTAWLFWFRASHRDSMARERPEPWQAMALFLLAAALLIVGRSQYFVVLEAFALIPLSLGVSLWMGGWPMVRALLFPHLFMLFLVPLPDSVVDGLTQPLKLAVSWSVEYILAACGFTVGRSGVMLILPPYRLLVADACSGMSSLFMLEAIGLLYINLVRHTSALRNTLLAVLIVPISFTSNVMRVLILALLTHYFGDEVSSGIMHSFSGVILFVTGLVITISVDSGLQYFVVGRTAKFDAEAGAASTRLTDAGQAPLPTLRPRVSVGLLAGAALIAGAAHVLTPQPSSLIEASDLRQAVPTELASWKLAPDQAQVDMSTTTPGAKTKAQPYKQVVMRTYERADGRRVMLALAYTGAQQQDVKVHRPEVCYPAQGASVTPPQPMMLTDGPAMRMLATRSGRRELVVYWIRIDNERTPSSWRARWLILREGLKGRLIDGSLLRTSVYMEPDESVADAEQLLRGFISELHQGVLASPQGREAMHWIW
jgi:exosortase B